MGLGGIYEICADEAWTHGATPPLRYWCFLGGLFGTQGENDQLERALRDHLALRGFRSEVKWSGTTPVTKPLYLELVDIFFARIEATGLAYRQTFLDRSHVYVPRPGEPLRSDLDVQFLIYYQFLKHHFGLQHLPAASRESPHRILLRLDNHSSQNHKRDLIRFVHDLPAQLGRRDLAFHVTFVNSRSMRRLQLCDVLMGAAGSYGNRMHLRRQPGKRGMNPRQRARLELARHIYGKIRAIDAKERGSKVFHWFESTGDDGDVANRLIHSVRVWKFVPERHKIDFGFRNRNLDSQGRYRGPKWTP